MPLGDGTQWDETNPQQSTEADTLDAVVRDVRVGTRLRMQNEHFWPSSETASIQAGQHVFVSFQAQTGAPAFQVNNSGTSMQAGVLWIDTSSNLWFTSYNLAGTVNNSIQLVINGTYGGSNIKPVAYVKCSNTQAQNTAGGATVSGGWNNLILNTKDSDTYNIATLTANQIALPAGTYRVSASCPFFLGGGLTSVFQLRLQNITATALLLTGTSTSTTNSNANDESIIALLSGIFTLTTASTIALQYQVSTSQAANGQGVPANLGTEVYTTLELDKIG